MSIEIRRATDGDCVCPHPHPDGTWRCRHWWECDWGPLTNTEADPRRGLQPLMVITPDAATRLLQGGPEPSTRGEGTVSATQVGERLFIHYDSPAGERTTWELFEAHFRHRRDFAVLLGRWPD